MGCMLGQVDPETKSEYAIYYLSKKFIGSERNYSALEKTCSALVWATRKLRQYMLYHTTLLVSRMDPIKYIFKKPAFSGRVAKWQMLLTEYDIDHVTQKAIKGSAVADYLAQGALSNFESIEADFPDGSLMTLTREPGKPESEGVEKFDEESMLNTVPNFINKNIESALESLRNRGLEKAQLRDRRPGLSPDLALSSV